MPLSPIIRGEPLTQRHKILSQNTRGSKLSYGENPKSLSYRFPLRYRVVTDRRPDGFTVANTRKNLRTIKTDIIYPIVLITLRYKTANGQKKA